MTSTRNVMHLVTALCAEYDELRATIAEGTPELQELQKMRDRVRNHDKTVGELHKCYNDIRLLQTALEMAAIDKWYDMTEVAQSRLEAIPGQEPWHALIKRWREKAVDRIDQEDSE